MKAFQLVAARQEPELREVEVPEPGRARCCSGSRVARAAGELKIVGLAGGTPAFTFADAYRLLREGAVDGRAVVVPDGCGRPSREVPA